MYRAMGAKPSERLRFSIASFSSAFVVHDELNVGPVVLQSPDRFELDPAREPSSAMCGDDSRVLGARLRFRRHRDAQLCEANDRALCVKRGSNA